ncbi:unnamed protein product [Sphenostylis stenocarpa]|uniref:Uncharacterized protein n=1 Tax=Sphenostylis stenocarpa TaxID=92480 RepID=A0AA86S8H8_9FABA|nr:unnamed protein product [Sphenostylis stenocarpa]
MVPSQLSSTLDAASGGIPHMLMLTAGRSVFGFSISKLMLIKRHFDTGGLSYIASTSVKVLQGLWMGDLATLKGSCPNCGEKVFAFVKTDKADASSHRADCHVCECLLEFRTKVEQSDLR